jgi:hypothetical protein
VKKMNTTQKYFYKEFYNQYLMAPVLFIEKNEILF